MAAYRKEQADKFVRGVCKYVSQLHGTGKVPEFPEEEFFQPQPLRNLLHRCIDNVQQNFLMSYHSYLYVDDRVNCLERIFKFKLKKSAREYQHLEFLDYCASYIIAANFLKQNGFAEAPDIARVAMYEAIIDSEQHSSLHQWH